MTVKELALADRNNMAVLRMQALAEDIAVDNQRGAERIGREMQAKTRPIPLANFRRQYATNLTQLRGMLAQAEAVTPKKYHGYTTYGLRAAVARFEALAALDDVALAAHLSRVVL